MTRILCLLFGHRLALGYCTRCRRVVFDITQTPFVSRPTASYGAAVHEWVVGIRS